MTISKSSIVQTCGGCPSQWNAESEGGQYIYIRLRHGYFYLEVNGETIFEDNPEGFDGVMSTDEMIELVNRKSSVIEIK